MKNKATELDVDFIGGQGSLTKDEEKRISEFIKAQKLLRAKQHPDKNRDRRARTSPRTKVVA